ncbi:hypothetical protein ABHF33_09275 [Chitinibacter sp. FCG-7]|uniref:Uncharacterized protein n=1 Tax=Chitinibacter mangrovi TaxID=3153927 RepID=A0AAU7F3N4_9NEIS
MFEYDKVDNDHTADVIIIYLIGALISYFPYQFLFPPKVCCDVGSMLLGSIFNLALQHFFGLVCCVALSVQLTTIKKTKTIHLTIATTFTAIGVTALHLVIGWAALLMLLSGIWYLPFAIATLMIVPSIIFWSTAYCCRYLNQTSEPKENQ